MASPSEVLSQRAYREAKAGIVGKVAENLRARGAELMIGGIISSPPAPDWNALAEEAINNRTIGGTSLNDLPKTPDGKSVNDLIPDQRKIDGIAREVAAGVKDNTGSMGFLKGATIGQAFGGLWDMIKEKGFMAAIGGVFNMIFGDGKSENAIALQQKIGLRTANAISEGVQQRLTARAGELGLTQEQIQQIGAQTQNSVRTQVGLAPVPVPGESQTPPTAGDPSTAIRNAIRGKVMEGFGLKAQGDQIIVDPANTAGAARLNQMAMAAGVGQFNDSQRTAIVNTMTDALQQVATANPPIRDPNAVRDSIKANLAENATAMGLGGMTEVNRQAMVQIMSNEMTATYLKARPVDRAAGAAFEVAMQPENQRLQNTIIQSSIRPAMFNTLAPQVLNGLEDDIIKKIREQREKLNTEPKPEPINTQLKARMDEMLRDDKSPEGRAKLLSFATAMGGPSQRQREAMAEEVGEAMVGVLTDKNNKGKSPTELAPAMERAVKERLTAARGRIDAMNPTSRFRLTDELINAAGTSVATQTRGMNAEQQAQITQAQNMIDYNAPAQPIDFTLNVQRVSDFAQSMPAIADRNVINQAVRSQVRSQVVQQINEKREQGVRDSYIARTVDFAVSAGGAPNDSQRDRIADLVAEETANVMSDPSISADSKPDRVRDAVKARLEAEKGSLNASFKNGGYANDPMNALTFAFYKWSIDNSTINEIANGASSGVRSQLAQGDQMAMLNALSSTIQVEAPRVPTGAAPTAPTAGRS
jgi:hypothetical protein